MGKEGKKPDVYSIKDPKPCSYFNSTLGPQISNRAQWRSTLVLVYSGVLWVCELRLSLDFCLVNIGLQFFKESVESLLFLLRVWGTPEKMFTDGMRMHKWMYQEMNPGENQWRTAIFHQIKTCTLWAAFLAQGIRTQRERGAPKPEQKQQQQQQLHLETGDSASSLSHQQWAWPCFQNTALSLMGLTAQHSTAHTELVTPHTTGHFSKAQEELKLKFELEKNEVSCGYIGDENFT